MHLEKDHRTNAGFEEKREVIALGRCNEIGRQREKGRGSAES